jgi:ribonuclease T2
MRAFSILVLLLFFGWNALAHAACELPDIKAVSVSACPRAETVRTGQRPPEGYLLALSWSPGYCARRGEKADAWQCQKNQFGWIVHGLWPQYNDGTWPSWCAPTATLPVGMVREQLCTMPGSTLVQCQWAKHGTCTPFTPEQYFKKAKELFEDINVPHKLFGGSIDRTQFLKNLADANPNRPAGSIALSCRQRRFLDEIRLCYDAELHPAACQNLKQTCTASKLVLPSKPHSVEPDHAKTY